MNDAAQTGREGEAASPSAALSFPDIASMRMALEAGHIGVWEWNVKTNAVRWSRELEHIHALPEGGFDGAFATFQKDIHPEDQPEVLVAVQESLRSRKPFHAHYRLSPRSDADERW